MGILNRVINAVMGWLVMSAGRRAHLAIRISEAGEARAALELASKLIESGEPADVALGTRLRAAVAESASLRWEEGDMPAGEADLLAEALGRVRPRHALNGSVNGNGNGNGKGNGRAALAAPRRMQPDTDPEIATLFDEIDWPASDPDADPDDDLGLTLEDDPEPKSEPEAPPMPPKRKRGRPPKKSRDASAPGDDAPGSADPATPTAQQQPPQPPKRPRGRPRKHPRPGAEGREGGTTGPASSPSGPPSPRPASS
ncbi:hypothetical protein [Tautonia rosea]|uniref:hypothetical protein n=1 Tax=Tautonia rosea TaxID=2728037 RepID=UPI0014764975|nr:hypothetical protein [Tautonia rosea]